MLLCCGTLCEHPDFVYYRCCAQPANKDHCNIYIRHTVVTIITKMTSLSITVEHKTH